LDIRPERRVRLLTKAAFIGACMFLSAGLTVTMFFAYAAIGTCDYECPSETTFTIVKVLLVVGGVTFVASVGAACWWAARSLRRGRSSTSR
jgi:hypothetical protein